MPPNTRGQGHGASTSRGRGRRSKIVESSSSSSQEEVEVASDSSSTDSDTQPTSTLRQRSVTSRQFADATMEIDEFAILELDAPTASHPPPIPSRPTTPARPRTKRTHPTSEIVIAPSKRLRHASTSGSVPLSSPPLSPTSQPSMTAPSPHAAVSSPVTPVASTMPHTPTSTPQAQTPLVPRNLRVFNADFHVDEDRHRKLLDNRSKKVFSCRSVSFRGDRAIQSLQEYFVDCLPYFEFLD